MLMLSAWTRPLPGYFKASLIVMGAICLYAAIIGLIMIRVNKRGKTKSKFVLLNVAAIKKFNNVVKGMIGKHWKKAAPGLLGIAIFIFLANISSLFGLQPPTAKTSITVALGIYAIGFVQFMGIVSRKHRHIKTWFEPMAFMFPINIFSDLTPVISLSLRLFGNIVSGTVLLTLAYGFLQELAPLVTPVLHLVFDIVFGAVQAAVFVFLTLMFASEKLEVGDINPDEIEEERLLKEEKLRIKQEKKEARIARKKERQEKRERKKAKEVN